MCVCVCCVHALRVCRGVCMSCVCGCARLVCVARRVCVRGVCTPCVCVLCVVCSGGGVYIRVCVWGRVYVGVHALRVRRGVSCGVYDVVCVWVCTPCVCRGCVHVLCVLCVVYVCGAVCVWVCTPCVCVGVCVC